VFEIFLILSVAFAIDCHDREAFSWTASPRPLNGGDIRTLMDKAPDNNRKRIRRVMAMVNRIFASATTHATIAIRPAAVCHRPDLLQPGLVVGPPIEARRRARGGW
jgi:hypothetical protein